MLRHIPIELEQSSVVLVPTEVGRVTLTALIGGCLGSGIDEDRG